jgi:hypothetical protein
LPRRRRDHTETPRLLPLEHPRALNYDTCFFALLCGPNAPGWVPLVAKRIQPVACVLRLRTVVVSSDTNDVQTVEESRLDAGACSHRSTGKWHSAGGEPALPRSRQALRPHAKSCSSRLEASTVQPKPFPFQTDKAPGVVRGARPMSPTNPRPSNYCLRTTTDYSHND